MDKHDIFISYSRKDLKQVESIIKKIEEQGFSVWIDKDGIECGENFSKIIVSAIESSTVVLFFSSVSSNCTEWTAKEIGVANDRKKKIIPIKLDNSKYSSSIEMHLILLDYIDFSNGVDDSTMGRLLRSITKEIHPEVMPTTQPEETEQEKGKDYSSSFTESSMWKKIGKSAKKAGKDLIIKVLKLYYALKLNKVNTKQTIAIIAALGYFIAPFDAITDFLPGGFVDDAGLLTATIASISACSDPEVVNTANKKCEEWF